MRSVVTCVLLFVATACQAQVIRVSDQVPMPAKYPAEVYSMTDAEFFTWATLENQTQREDWNKRKAAIKEPEYINGTETTTSAAFDGYGSPYGGYGYGYGYGYGGSRDSGGFGAYAPYSNHRSSSEYAGAARERTVTFPRRLVNPQYVGPGPLTIVNPFVRPTK